MTDSERHLLNGAIGQLRFARALAMAKARDAEHFTGSRHFYVVIARKFNHSVIAFCKMVRK